MGYPSCRHNTVASLLPQESSHTVPHRLFMQISTLPSFGMLPPASRSWPCIHGAVNMKYILYQQIHYISLMCLPSHPTPASAEWRQSWDRIGLLEHSSSWLGFKLHWTSSRKIGPLPVPKWALLYALPPAYTDTVHEHNHTYIKLMGLLPVYENPSCLQTTVASVLSQ